MTTPPENSIDEIARYATNGLAAHIGIEIVELSRERVVATMPVDDRTRQPYGLLHGGASVALAETVAPIASIINIDQHHFRAVASRSTRITFAGRQKVSFAAQPHRFT